MNYLDLIKGFEGLRLDAYQDSVGVWTIGYGTTADAGIGIVPRPGMKITQEQAEAYLARGIEKVADAIRPAITRPINGNEWAAFLSLAYNIGNAGFKSSSALRQFNAGDKQGAADAILLWNKGTIGGKKVVIKGLENRRKKEREVFLTPVSKGSNAPIAGPIAAIGAAGAAAATGIPDAAKIAMALLAAAVVIWFIMRGRK